MAERETEERIKWCGKVSNGFDDGGVACLRAVEEP